MNILFVVSEPDWSPRARAFLLAARGLVARGHGAVVVCAAGCPVQLRATESNVPIVSMNRDASTAGITWQLRKTIQERDIDVVFVHTDNELLVASSAVRLGRGGSAAIQRISPFTIKAGGRGARLATRIAPTGLLFATEIDRDAVDATRHRVPSAVAPLAVDPAVHESVRAVAKASIGAPSNSRLIVCVHDGDDKYRVFALLRTMALLAPRHPDLHLVILGAPHLEELRMQGAALGINKIVTYLGAREDELSVIRAADVGWLAAEGDAAAFAALDFMAFRIPVIADRTALTEHYIADGIAGVLLPPADPTTTAAAVAAFLVKEEQRVAMGKAGRARLQREFSYEAMIAGYERAIAGAVGQTAGAPQPAAQTVP